MAEKVIYAGDEPENNWMDFRDGLIEALKKCENEFTFNKIILAIYLSVNLSPEQVNETRKTLGLKPLSQKEMNRIKKLAEEEKLQEGIKK